MKLRAFCGILDKIAATRFAAKWDNVGLLVEPADVLVKKVFLTNDLTEVVLQEVGFFLLFPVEIFSLAMYPI